MVFDIYIYFRDCPLCRILLFFSISECYVFKMFCQEKKKKEKDIQDIQEILTTYLF